MFARNKTLTISEHQFLALLESAFLNNYDSHDSLVAQWNGQQRDALSAANILTCLDPAALAAKKREEAEMGIPPPSASPSWYSDGRVSVVMRAFDDAYRHAGSAAGQVAAADQQGGKAAIVRLCREFDEAVDTVGANKSSNNNDDKSSEQRVKALAFVVGAIVTAVAGMLFIDASGVSPSKPVAALGVDSLIAAELRNWFHVALGTSINTLDLLDAHMSISQLAVGVLDKALERRHTDGTAGP